MSNLRKNEPRVITLASESVLPGERKLVLRRLRPPPRYLHLKLNRILLGGVLALLTGILTMKKALLLIAGLFSKPLLIRKVGPNNKPLPEHLWEESRHLQSIHARMKL